MSREGAVTKFRNWSTVMTIRYGMIVMKKLFQRKTPITSSAEEVMMNLTTGSL